MKLNETWVLYDICMSEIVEVFSDKNKAIELYDINIKDCYIKNRELTHFFKDMSDEQYDEHFKKYFSNTLFSVITLDEAIENIKEKLTDYFESIIYTNYN